MEITTSSLISLAAMVAAIIGSAAVAQFKINSISDQVKRLFQCKSDMDHRLDLIEQGAGLVKHRLDIVTNILSPQKLEKDSRELATLKSEIDHLKKIMAKNGHT